MLLSMGLLLAFSAFFSASETAISSINKFRVKNRAEEGDKKAAVALKNAEDYDRTLSTILIGNNVVNLTLSSLATLTATALLGDAGAAVATIAATLLVLTFGEILPKSFAKDNAERVALATARPLWLLRKLLAPLVWFFVMIKRLFTNQHNSELNVQPSVTEDELKTIVSTVEDEGVLDPQETDIIQSAIDFGDTTVQEILVPRVDMIAVEADAAPEELLHFCVDHTYSRIPVYEKKIDNIIGILYARDLLESLVRGRSISARALMRPVLYVYRTKHINELLAEFRREKQHIAIVTDDYGGVMGMVTLEDILEELVGEIWDETDTQRSSVRPLSENSWEVSGEENIEDCFAAIGFSDRDFHCDYATVAGWALEVLEHIPTVGEQFRYKVLLVTVEEMEDQRILRLRIDRQPETEAAAEPAEAK